MRIGINDDGSVEGVTGAQKLLEDIPSKINNYLGIIAQVEVEQVEKKPGGSGIRIQVKPSLLLEGYRPGKIVRVYPAGWPVIILVVSWSSLSTLAIRNKRATTDLSSILSLRQTAR